LRNVTDKLATLPFAYFALLAFWTVLIAEIVGDKSIYTVGSLALRFRPLLVFGGITLAFAGKMFVAVLLGRVLVLLSPQRAAVLSACAFFLSATLIWFGEKDETPRRTVSNTSSLQAAFVCFATLFFTEWGDPGQIAAAALALKSHWLLATWLGGTLAMMTKGTLAMTLGVKLRDRIPRRTLRTVACTSCCVLGVLALGGAAFH
jgi:putative Ca2+/H+ antiporter (TMEM165/GDT1 family)